MQYPRDGRLWLIAGALSLLLNVAILSLIGIAALQTQRRHTTPPSPPAESSVWIYPSEPEATGAVAAAPESPAERPFARTSPEQESMPENPARFIGERDTAATSERRADPTAAPLPSQSGIEPRYEGDLETTESDYQDGSLAEAGPDAPTMDDTSAPSDAAAGGDPSAASPPPPSSAAPAEQLYAGPDPIDIPVAAHRPMENVAPAETPTPAEESPAETLPAEDTAKAAPPSAAPAAAPKEKSFSGFQRKTAIIGSISRTGRSSLDVENTPLGRYQAAISKAVELEWQRNCVRHRDFITPGYLTARFFVESSGKVKSVQFVGEMQTGEIQKGFTLNSIRDAEIPAMPAALKKEFRDEPLELVFRFFF